MFSHRLFSLTVALLCLLALSASAQAAPVIDLPDPVTPEPEPFSDRYPAVVYLPARANLELLLAMEIDIDNVRLASEEGAWPGPQQSYQPLIATVYVNPAEADSLAQNGLEVIPIPNETLQGYIPGIDAQPPTWPTYTEIISHTLLMEQNYPHLAYSISISNTVQGRPIQCMKISDNVVLQENEPEFRYIAAIHGNETTGIEMTLRLAELLLSSYDTDPTLAALVDGLEIWICPVANPDGYMNNSRYNAHGEDLNRSFPDRFIDPSDTPDGHEPEVQAFWYFGKDHYFVMGANYHGGAQVANVPWDAIDEPPIYAPDDGIFLDWARGYAALNIDLLNGGWPDGVTRGWEWYEIYGGLQDYSYYYNGEHHITLEISNTKAPLYNENEMDTYWEHNREAMLYWMSQALTGMHGLVLDAVTNEPLTATLTIQGMDLPNFIHTDPDVGDYHRVIGAGTYTLVAAADGYESITHTVTISEGQSTTQDFSLCPIDNLAGTVTQANSNLPLGATLELLELSLQTTSNPQNGQYAFQVCQAGTYTLRASAPGHLTQERPVTISSHGIEDFILLYADLAASTKTTSANSALPGQPVTYTISADINNLASNIAITDTLPTGLDWNGVLTATRGLPAYADGQITWSGVLTPGQPLTITYGVTVAACLPGGATLTNLAEFENNVGIVVSRLAEVQILNAAPEAPALLTPAQGAEEQPPEVSLSWQASTDLNCDPLTYTLYLGAETPLPVASGLTTTTFTASDLLPGVTYSWYVVVSDGQATATSPVWQFTTAPLRFFIPYLSRNG